MFIPVAVGLLDSSGKDMPLTSIYHDGKVLNIRRSEGPVYTTILRVTKVSLEVTNGKLLFRIRDVWTIIVMTF